MQYVPRLFPVHGHVDRTPIQVGVPPRFGDFEWFSGACSEPPDQKMEDESSIAYFRYVDDILILMKDDESVRIEGLC